MCHTKYLYIHYIYIFRRNWRKNICIYMYKWLLTVINMSVCFFDYSYKGVSLYIQFTCQHSLVLLSTHHFILHYSSLSLYLNSKFGLKWLSVWALPFFIYRDSSGKITDWITNSTDYDQSRGLHWSKRKKQLHNYSRLRPITFM